MTLAISLLLGAFVLIGGLGVYFHFVASLRLDEDRS